MLTVKFSDAERDALDVARGETSRADHLRALLRAGAIVEVPPKRRAPRPTMCHLALSDAEREALDALRGDVPRSRYLRALVYA